jgi:hapalindole-type alkaloid chlorinase
MTLSDQERATRDESHSADDSVPRLFARWGLASGRVILGWRLESVTLADDGRVACASFARAATNFRVSFKRAGADPRFARVGGIDIAHDKVPANAAEDLRLLMPLIVAWLKKHGNGAALVPLLAAGRERVQPAAPAPARTLLQRPPDAPGVPREFPDLRRFADALLSNAAFRSTAGLPGPGTPAASAEFDGLGVQLDEERARIDAGITRTVDAEWKALAEEGLRLEGATLPALVMPPDYAASVAVASVLERTVPGEGHGETLDDMYLRAIPRNWLRQLAVRSVLNQRLLHSPLDWERLPRLRRMIEQLFAETEQAGGSTIAYLGAPTAREFFASARTIAELYDGSYWGRYMPLQDLSPTELAAVGHFLEGDAATEPIADLHLSAPLFHDLSHGRRARVALSPPNLDECVTAYLGVRAAPNLLLSEPGEANGLQVIGWYAQVGQALARVVGWEHLVRAYTGVESWSAVLSPALSRAIVRLAWDDYFHYRHPSFQPRVYRPDAWLKLFFLSGAGVDVERFDMAALERLPWTDVPAGEPAPFDEEIVRDGLRAMCVHHFLDGDWLRVGRRLPQRPIDIDLGSCRIWTASDPGSADPVPPAYLFPPAVAARLRDDGIAALSLELRDAAAIPEAVANVLEGRSARGTGFTIDVHRRTVNPGRATPAPIALESAETIDAPLLTPDSFVKVYDVDVDDLHRFPNGLDDIRKERLQGFLIRNVMPVDVCAEIVARLERKDVQFLELSFQKTYGAQLLGRPVDMSDPTLTQYFHESREFRDSCRRLFAGGPDYEDTMEAVCRRIGGGRSVRVPPARRPDEGSYTSSTIRILPPGGQIGVHCGNEAMHRVTYGHLNTMVENVDQISFFLTLQAPEGGGELTIFSLRHDMIDSTMMNKEGNRCYVDDVIDRYQRVAVRPRTGDLLIFDGGRYFHLVSHVQGETTRWTIGGFIGFGRDENWVYYWS